jgi:hypothetical protein
MIKFLLLALSQVSVLHAAFGSCPSLKKISGSEDWWSCWHYQMRNCENGCCCEDGYEYKKNGCKGMGNGKGKSNSDKFNGAEGYLEVGYDFAAKCCWNKHSLIFPGDMRDGQVVRSVDGCTEWTCVDGVMKKSRKVIRNPSGIDLCKQEPDCEEGYTKVKGYPWVNIHEYTPEAVAVSRKACANGCKADDNCIAYTAKGVCMPTQAGQTFSDLRTREPEFLGINYCVKDKTTVATGPNSCEWKHQIPGMTTIGSLEDCARECAENTQCKGFYLWVKNQITPKPLCVGFSQPCTGSASTSSTCADNQWCGYNLIKA